MTAPSQRGAETPKPKLEKVKRCEWPTKCVIEATTTAIDFGYRPVQVYQFCAFHSRRYKDVREAYVILEEMKR